MTLTEQVVAKRDGSEFAAVLAREEFRIELDRLFPTREGRRESKDVRLQMLRYHGNRCVFDVRMKTDSGWESVIVKLFTIDRQDAFSAMEKIHQGGFGEGAEFAVPRPIAYLSPSKILIEEKVEGRQAKEILIADNQSEQVEAVQRAGAWLTRFHTTAPRFGNLVQPKALLEHIRAWADMVSDFGGPFPARCELLMEKLGDALPEEGTFEYCPGHGSFIPSHVLLNKQRTVTIDFDEFELVDPARDLAWFMISVERYSLKYHRPPGYYERLTQPFLESYMKGSSKNALRHLAFYKGAEYLHRARHDLYKRIPPVPEWAEMMLDHAISEL